MEQDFPDKTNEYYYFIIVIILGGISHVPPGWDFWAGLVGNSKYGIILVYF